MLHPQLAALISGITSAGIFAIANRGAADSSLLAYFSFLPLLAVGFSYGLRNSALAGCVALLITVILLGLEAFLFFFVLIFLPVILFLHSLLRFRNVDEQAEWYPVLLAITELSVFSAALFMAIALFASGYEPGGLPIILQQTLPEITKHQEPQIAEMVGRIVADWGFLLFAIPAWMWVLLLYACAHTIQSLLSSYFLSLRPDFRLLPVRLPSWLFALFFITLLLAGFGKGEDRFAAMVVLLILMLPYFLSGISLLKAQIALRNLNDWWLYILYLLIFLFLWPAAIIAFIGMTKHASEILDKPSQMG